LASVSAAAPVVAIKAASAPMSCAIARYTNT
jgi:hypothetical protein